MFSINNVFLTSGGYKQQHQAKPRNRCRRVGLACYPWAAETSIAEENASLIATTSA